MHERRPLLQRFLSLAACEKEPIGDSKVMYAVIINDYGIDGTADVNGAIYNLTRLSSRVQFEHFRNRATEIRIKCPMSRITIVIEGAEQTAMSASATDSLSMTLPASNW